MRHPAARSQSIESNSVTRPISSRFIGRALLPVALGLAGCGTEIEPTGPSADLSVAAQAVAGARGITGRGTTRAPSGLH